MARVSPLALGSALAIALLVSITVAVTIGPADIRVDEVWRSIASHLGIGVSPLSELRDGIVWQLRLPRVLTAAAVGAGLALSGAVMQAITRNPLADPYLLGLSSGAALGAVSVLLLGAAVLLPLAAFIGALLALTLTLLLAGSLGAITPSRTVLAGIAVSALASAITSFVIFWSVTGDSYREVLSWLLGSLSGARWPAVGITMVAIIVIGIPVMLTGRLLDSFAFGDVQAASLGVNACGIRSRHRSNGLGQRLDRLCGADSAACRALARRARPSRAAAPQRPPRCRLSRLGRHTRSHPL